MVATPDVTHGMPMRLGRRFNMLGFLPKDIQADFFSATTARHYSAGQFIYERGDRGDEMFRLVSGMARLTVMRHDGREVVFSLYQPEDCFGISSLIDDDPRGSSADAITDLEVQVLKRDDFDRLREKHRVFEDALMRLLCADVNMFGSYFADAKIHDLPNSLARRLIEISRRDDTGQLVVNLSQADLASTIGLSRQTTNKILREFERSRMITLGYGTVILRNLSALKKLARNK